MLSKRSFSLVELLFAIVLVGVVLLAVTSVDITSRKFFLSTKDSTRLQDAIKIAMEQMVKDMQQGIGDMSNARNVGDDPFDILGCSRGYYILDDSNRLANSNDDIRVKIDNNRDGRFTASPPDGIVRYYYDVSNYRINRVVAPGGSVEAITDSVITNCNFSMGSAPNANVVNILIQARSNPTQPAGPENPETSLTSSVVLRAMSISQ